MDKVINMKDFEETAKRQDVKKYTNLQPATCPNLRANEMLHQLRTKHFQHMPQHAEEFIDCCNVLQQIAKEAGHKGVIVSIKP